MPTRNKTFWLAKFAANEERDRRNLTLIKGMGLRSLVIWECQTTDVERLARRLSKSPILR
jgi:DNA mismatch endonuclease (patch repair protein)